MDVVGHRTGTLGKLAIQGALLARVVRPCEMCFDLSSPVSQLIVMRCFINRIETVQRPRRHSRTIESDCEAHCAIAQLATFLVEFG
jgi:hypothetical protein